ncbi:GntR family transcriptional regulator, partial [Streptomyces parvus]|nr:GntR family transcriptional regulator [Streptomyces parvus]
MEQGSAREGARPAYAPGVSPYASGNAARAPQDRVPEQARGRQGEEGQTRGRHGEEGQARGEHTHSEPPAPRAVQRHSVRGQILDALRAALVDGELVPGQVYSAPALGARFGVSATPVREAMQRLAVEGAVEVVPNRGFRVTERGPRELA